MFYVVMFTQSMMGFYEGHFTPKKVHEIFKILRFFKDFRDFSKISKIFGILKILRDFLKIL